MKRLALAVTLISAALLSGCIIVPAHRHGGYRGGYGYSQGNYQGNYQGGYQGGPVYGQPGRR